MLRKRWLPAAALAILAAGRALGQGSSATDQQSEAYQASVSQDGLKRDAASVRAELVRVRDQMRQLLPDDVATVDHAIAQMDSLSKEQMDRVIATLRGASRPGALSGDAKALAEALNDQGTISASLKRLAISLDARQSAENMAAELSALLMRQVEAKDELSRLARKEQTPDRLRNRDEERYEVVNEDQKSVSEDIKLLLERFERVAQTLTGDSQQKFARAVQVAHDGKLDDLADGAAAQTAKGPFDQAVDTQGRTAALLVSMEQGLATETRPADRLAGLEDRLKKTLEQQQALTQTIAGFHERQSVETDTRRLQTTIGDQIAALGAEIAPLNSEAAADLQAAHDSTDKASLNYERMWEERASAQENTRNAVAQLTAALQSVEKQAAALPGQTPATPAQLDTALAALQRDTAQAAAIAQNRAAPGAAPAGADQQKALQDQVDALQQRALPVSPEAAQDLDNAAAQLRQPGAAAQQAAAQQLAQAAQTLAQQQAALEGRAPGQQALAQAEAQLAQASQGLAQVQPNLNSDKTSADAVNQLDAVKQEMAAAQRAAQQAGAPAAAAAALAQAAQDINQAQADAAGVQLPQAGAAAQAAQQAMAQAGQAMNAARQAPAQQAMAALASKAGNDPGKPQNDGGTPQGQGNGGGGKSGDFLAGAGASAGPLEPVSGLSPHDRAAVTQLQAEKPPPEFASEVQQYYKNIADGAGL